MDDLISLVFLMMAATLRVATPLVLCAMGGLFSEKSGIIDVGLEGKMLMAAFFAAATSAVTGSHARSNCGAARQRATGHRPDHLERAGGDSARCDDVQERPAVRRLVGTNSPAAQLGWQDSTGAH